MPPAPLANLYTSPNDVYDYLGTEGTQLRFDDANQASGQIIQATSAGVIGGTSFNITALTHPLLNGTVLQFEGGGMPNAAQVNLAAVGRVGDTTLTVSPLVAAINVQAQARDNGSNLIMANRLMKGCNYATARVQTYCLARYDDINLRTNWQVNRWATSLAAQWVGRRCSQGCPVSVEADVKDALAEMKDVQMGRAQIPGIGTRTSGWPFLSNVTVDIGYYAAKIRVEPSISEGTVTQYAQYIDWNSAMVLDWM